MHTFNIEEQQIDRFIFFITTHYIKRQIIIFDQPHQEGFENLCTLKSLRVLDLRSNSIDISQAQFYEKILSKLQQLPKLMSLYFQGNPVVIKIPLFRFFVIHELVKLEILDDAKITKSVIIFHLLF